MEQVCNHVIINEVCYTAARLWLREVMNSSKYSEEAKEKFVKSLKGVIFDKYRLMLQDARMKPSHRRDVLWIKKDKSNTDVSRAILIACIESGIRVNDICTHVNMGIMQNGRIIMSHGHAEPYKTVYIPSYYKDHNIKIEPFGLEEEAC